MSYSFNSLELTEVLVPKFPNQMIEMNKLIIVIHILLTVLLVGCATKGNYVGELKDGKKRKGIFIYANGRVEEGI